MSCVDLFYSVVEIIAEVKIFFLTWLG